MELLEGEYILYLVHSVSVESVNPGGFLVCLQYAPPQAFIPVIVIRALDPRCAHFIGTGRHLLSKTFLERLQEQADPEPCRLLDVSTSLFEPKRLDVINKTWKGSMFMVFDVYFA